MSTFAVPSAVGSTTRKGLCFHIDQHVADLIARGPRFGLDPELWREARGVCTTALSRARSPRRGASNDQVLYEVQTMEQLADDSLPRQRFLLLLFGIFAALALVLACMGIYGVLSYLINQRVPEIGIRIALGATAQSVVGLVLRPCLGLISLGVGIGTFAALAAGGILARLVEGMQPAQVSTFAIMIPILVLAALSASFVPARRASRVNPVEALRQE